MSLVYSASTVESPRSGPSKVPTPNSNNNGNPPSLSSSTSSETDSTTPRSFESSSEDNSILNNENAPRSKLVIKLLDFKHNSQISTTQTPKDNTPNNNNNNENDNNSNNNNNNNQKGSFENNSPSLRKEPSSSISLSARGIRRKWLEGIQSKVK